MNTTLVALISVPGILALVNLLKSIGLSGRWSALAAVLLGVGLSVAHWALADWGAWQAAESGIVLGLGAAGLWDVTKTTPPGEVTA
ncbi:hypothetical protein FAM19031_000597 [Propionibacterium freudenreichii]|uniref:hypothetical protein n=1 Tax=Propionibacterium freudenreichii TaxID=1744 RepID=UPI0024342A1D|nr:hypothetical protein [Propionibacterium freudenreichii]MDK9294559.1 hypothetical protein [Propionibacterium freudenreichii]MDK9359888.1 hypothetical protein [Propionibacterium freudenreichii]MDK9657921.1 hypothetical protein [Propionibacterium freudenreichii]WFF31074.1 hypothetical protein FAM19024_000262 [Propionibacterium freudenreichii]